MAMTLEQIGEFGLIERISKGCLIRPGSVLRGIGDDAAAVTVAGDKVLLLTTDLLVEGVHFLRRAVSGFDLGYKALAVNLSDIAAMGGIAREALASIAVPQDCNIDFIEELYRGMKVLAAEYDVNIIGGDTTRARSDLVISVTVTGWVEKENMLCRDGARMGDIICLTGFPGESAAGLHLILNQVDGDTDVFVPLLDRHRRPRPHLSEGRWLTRMSAVHAAIDISDGLGSDLGHVIRQSGVGARIDARSLPVSNLLKKFSQRLGLDPLDYVWNGGEDYILLCTVSPGKISLLSAGFEKKFDRPLYRIGEITTSGHVDLVDESGETRMISPQGWNHFRRK